MPVSPLTHPNMGKVITLADKQPVTPDSWAKQVCPCHPTICGPHSGPYDSSCREEDGRSMTCPTTDTTKNHCPGRPGPTKSFVGGQDARLPSSPPKASRGARRTTRPKPRIVASDKLGEGHALTNRVVSGTHQTRPPKRYPPHYFYIFRSRCKSILNRTIFGAFPNLTCFSAKYIALIELKNRPNNTCVAWSSASDGQCPQSLSGLCK